MSSREIKIDREFKAIIPPLSEDERKMLEESIVSEGCRDPLVIWRDENILLDGHNRYELCRKHKKEFDTTTVYLPDRASAKMWIIRNQLGRRNLPPFVRAELALKLEPLISAKAKDNQGKRTDLCQKSDKSSPASIDTKKEVARIAGVSHDTIHKAKAIAERASEPIKAALRSGSTTINKAYSQLDDDPPKNGKSKPMAKKREDKSCQVALPDDPNQAASELLKKFDEDYLEKLTVRITELLRRKRLAASRGLVPTN